MIKTTGISRIQRLESNIHTVPQFTEQELMRIIEVQQIHSTSEHSANAATQNDIDKLFE
ncbi:MAG: hypothetical protein WCI84_10605 [Bacteroidota bacterium]